MGVLAIGALAIGRLGIGRLAVKQGTFGGLDVENLTITPPSLEELFLRHYGDTLDDATPGRAAAEGETEELRTR